MKNIFHKLLGLVLFSPALLMATDTTDTYTGGTFNLSDKLNTVSQDTAESTDLLVKIVTAVLFILGLIFVAWGIYEVFIDEDRQKEGKKVKGIMKIAGGFFWMLIMIFVKFMTT